MKMGKCLCYQLIRSMKAPNRLRIKNEFCYKEKTYYNKF